MITSRLHYCKLWFGALALVAAGAVSGQSSIPSPDAASAGRGVNDRLSEPDHAFLLEAAAYGNLEIKMSRIAALRANSDPVRYFALNASEDHSKLRRRLKEIALSRDLEVSDELDPKRTDVFMTLQRYAGDEFDREYLTQQVVQHRRVVRLFQNQAQQGRNDELRNFAASKLAALEGYLKAAQALADNR